LSWTAVTNAASYILTINGTPYGTPYGNVTTTGTVTPGVSGQLVINLYAYNSSSVLLAQSVSTIYHSYLANAITASSVVPLIAYTFQSGSYNSSTQQFVNIANNKADNLYVYNYGDTVPYTTVGGFNAITFVNTGNTSQTFLNQTGSTSQFKASINRNPPTASTYTTALTSISPSTAYQGMTLSYWVYNNDTGGLLNISEWSNIAANNNIIYMERYNGKFSISIGSGSTIGSAPTFSANTWYHMCIKLPFSASTGTIYVTAYGGSTVTQVGTGTLTLTSTVGNYEFINTSTAANPQFVATLGCGFNDGGVTNCYMADYRVYGSLLSVSDLNAILVAGPK
jgi:hypothetical protein